MTIEVVLFDLGGVLVELGGASQLGLMVGESSDEEIWRRWLSCPWVRRFERGLCDPEEFARGMADTWKIPGEPEAFIEAFTAWPIGLYPGARELVAKLEGRVRSTCLSNTNELHTNRQWTEFGIDRLFDQHFFSHEIGLVKPDREIYDYVVEQLACPAASVLFLDDNSINVEGARAAGLSSELARGVDEAQAALVRHGVLEFDTPRG